MTNFCGNCGFKNFNGSCSNPKCEISLQFNNNYQKIQHVHHHYHEHHHYNHTRHQSFKPSLDNGLAFVNPNSRYGNLTINITPVSKVPICEKCYGNVVFNGFFHVCYNPYCR